MKALVLEAEWAPREAYPISDWEVERRWAHDGNKVWHNPCWSLQDAEEPLVREPYDVKIRVHACGVCGSDVHMYETDEDGYPILCYEMRLPNIMGHEFAGVVVEMGSAVTRFREGNIVAVEGINWCGRCRACQAGLLNQCPNKTDIGFTTPGGFAEYVVADEKYCWSLAGVLEAYDGDEDAALECGALVEPMGVAYEGVFKRSGGILPGGHVVVFGAGPIGLNAVALLRAGGAGQIIVFEPQPERRALAERVGATHSYDPSELERQGSSVSKAVLEATRGEGAAMFVEATGRYDLTMHQPERCMDLGAKVVVIGNGPYPPKINPVAYQNMAASMYGSLGHAGGVFGKVINLIAAKRIRPLEIVTGRYPLVHGLEALEKMTNHIDAKVLVKPGMGG
jgi:threonine dehydrogenase-like Zn-dependent dehydrogenase